MKRSAMRQQVANEEKSLEPTSGAKFVPALGFHSLTRLYDRLIAATLREDRFRRRLVGQARVAAHQRILDLGCGTGTLAIMMKRTHPEAVIVGLDADETVLSIARTKVREAGVEIELTQGNASNTPFPPQTFDRIVSSLVFHHLTTADKRRALEAARSLLRAGGELHVADWGRAQNPLMRVAFLAVQLLDGFATTADNVRGRLPELMAEAGFVSVEETHREMTIFGTLSLYKGSVP
jgi:cyclopropane fatty-acyl-phospholipid synthase-like methyltransferase